MKTILCFGDSITYGANPMPGGERHAYEDRWPGALEAALDGKVRVVPEGLGGRTTAYDDWLADADRNGARLLPTLLSSHGPLDMVIIMLGTNDLKPFLARTAQEAANGMRKLVRIVKAHAAYEGQAVPKIIVMSPPHVSDTDHPEMLLHFGQAAIAESHLFARWYKLRANEEGVAFFDASTVASPDPADGVHLNAANTRAIGEGLAPLVKSLLGI
ncbi:MAG: SGNH/GDSL hydrolase family protein [Devosia sp.]